MGWLKKTFKKAARIVKKAVKVVAPIPTVIINVVKGEKLDEAVKDVVKAPIDIGIEVHGALSDIENDISNAITKVIDKLAGEDARKVFEDFRSITKPVDSKTAQSYLKSLNDFIDTGDLESLNPLIAIVAGEIKEARDQYWDKGKPLTDILINSMPDDIKPYANMARYIDVKNASGLSLPSIATNHLNKASAIVTIDLIFFKNIPTTSTDEDLHLWCHEIFHVKQYNELGLEGFVQRYIGNEIGFQAEGSEGNGIEIEADLYSCNAFPIDNPAYLSKPCSEYN